MEQLETARAKERDADERAQGRSLAGRYSLMPLDQAQERQLLDLPAYWQTKTALQNPDGTFRFTIDDTGARLGDGSQRFGIDSFGRFVELV